MTCYGFIVLFINGSLRECRTNFGTVYAKDIGMDNSVNKATVPFLAIAMIIIAAIAAKVRATINAQVPEGYEDEAGFHFGSPPFDN